MKLFIYGTLKTGCCRNPLINSQVYLCEVQTQPKYRMYNFGPYPTLVECEDGVSIKGELWMVDDDCLKQLDLVEGTPELFKREKISLAESFKTYKDTEAYFYQRSTEGLEDCGPCWHDVGSQNVFEKHFEGMGMAAGEVEDILHGFIDSCRKGPAKFKKYLKENYPVVFEDENDDTLQINGGAELQQ